VLEYAKMKSDEMPHVNMVTEGSKVTEGSPIQSGAVRRLGQCQVHLLKTCAVGK